MFDDDEAEDTALRKEAFDWSVSNRAKASPYPRPDAAAIISCLWNGGFGIEDKANRVIKRTEWVTGERLGGRIDKNHLCD